MQIQLTPNVTYTRGLRATGSCPASPDLGPSVPLDSVTLSPEAARPSRSWGGLRSLGMSLALGAALVGVGLAAGPAHSAETAKPPVSISQTVGASAASTNTPVPVSQARQAGRVVHEVGMKGKEVGLQIGQTGKNVGLEVGRAGKDLGLKVGAAAKDFWAGLRGK